MEFVFFWIAFCLLVGFLANRFGRSPVGWFLLAFVISPLLAGLFLLVAGNAKPTPATVQILPPARSPSIDWSKVSWDGTGPTVSEIKAAERVQAEDQANYRRWIIVIGISAVVLLWIMYG